MKIISENIEFLKAKINKSSLSKRLFEGMSWTLIGNIFGKFIQLLAFIFVARIVGKQEYGQVETPDIAAAEHVICDYILFIKSPNDQFGFFIKMC